MVILYLSIKGEVDQHGEILYSCFRDVLYQFLFDMNEHYMPYLGDMFTLNWKNCIKNMPVKDSTGTLNGSKTNVATAPTRYHSLKTFPSFYIVNFIHMLFPKFNKVFF